MPGSRAATSAIIIDDKTRRAVCRLVIVTQSANTKLAAREFLLLGTREARDMDCPPTESMRAGEHRRMSLEEE